MHWLADVHGREVHELMSDAHSPAWYDKNTVIAIRALAAGVASEGQQKAALDWIINHAARLYDMSYRPGDAHATAFAEGRRFAGSQVVKMLRDETLQAASQERVTKRRGKRQEASE